MTAPRRAVFGASLAGTATLSGTPVFAVPPTSIPIVGTEQVFPVRRIYRSGRNHAAHAREIDRDATHEPPLLFQTPTGAIRYVPTGPMAKGDRLLCRIAGLPDLSIRIA